MNLPAGVAVDELLDGLGVNLWTFEHASGRLSWSAGARRLLDLPADSADAAALLERTHPDDRAAAEAAVVALVGGAPTFLAEQRLARPGGGWRWVRSRASVVERDAEGNPARTVGTLEDVSAHKEAELDARRRQRELDALQAELVVRDRYQRALLDNIPHMVWLKDHESRLLAANLAYARVAGVGTTEELVGHTDLDYWRPELAEGYRADDRAVLASGKPKSVEEAIEAQGEPLWIETYKSPVFVDGEVIGTVGFARDITEQKRARQRLEASEAALRASLAESVRMEAQLQQERSFLRSLLRALPDLVWLKDPDGVYLACNSRFEELYGAPEAEILGKTDASFVPPEVAAGFRANDLAAIEAGAPRRNEEILTFANGYRGLFETTKTPMYTPDGRLIGALGIAHDISAARGAETALRETEFRWNAALEGAGLGVWDWSPRTGHGYFSPVWWRLIGYDPEHLPEPAPSWLELLHPQDREKAVALLAAYLAGESPEYRAEYRLRCADGSYRWLATGGVIVARDENGHPSRLVGVHFDIHDRKEAEARVQESAAALDQAQMLARMGSWHLDLRTQQLRCSDEVFRIYGVGAADRFDDDLMTRHVHPDDLPLVAERWAEAIVSGDYDSEHRAITGHGTRWVRVRGTLTYEAGAPATVSGSLQDVTERKEAELELERHRRNLQELVDARTEELVSARDAAEAANRTKSAFLANMSHEIRTPLNAILGLTHLIRQSTTTPRQLAQLDRVGEAAQHLLALLNNILDLSKIEAGKLELSNLGYEPARVLARVADLVRDRATDKGLRVSVEVDPTLPSRVGGDALRVGQVLLNFASNAVKFTEHGEVDLVARRVSHGAPRLRLEVRDTGPGLTTEQQERLFQPFEQGDASTTRRHGGTGLGLAISRRLAEMMRGRVGVDTAPGAGCTFWCELPLTEPAALGNGADPTPPDARPAGSGSQRVLVVEDNPINRDVAVELLGTLGLEVDTAADGVEAVARIADTDYGLILMDLHMPRMDGLEATRMARRLPRGADVPILALSADAFASSRQACLDAGMTDHLAKPVDPMALVAAVRRWLPDAGPPAEGDPAEPPDPSGWAALKAVPGLDAAAGEARMGHRRAAYLDVLRRFVRAHATDAEAVRDEHAAGRPGPARQRLHALRGVCGTLGLVELQRRAGRLEAAGSLDAAELDAFVTGFGDTVRALRAALPLPAPAPGPGELARGLQLARHLLRYVEQDDARSTSALEAAAPHLAPLLGEAALAQLHREIDVFDFPAAARTLRAALDNSG